MANFQKFGRDGLAGLFKHDDRGKYVTDEMYHSNKDIKPELTHLNYSLLASEESAMERYERRLSEVHCSKRADVNTLVSWIVTKPQDLPDGKEEEFFRETYSFLVKRYGEENVIVAAVHKDESQPHIHFDFIPIVTDKKKGYEKVSAKERIDRAELQHFHTDLQKHLEKELGCPVSILNGATINGNRTMLQLKNEKLQEKNRELLAENGALESIDRCNETLKEMESLLRETNTAVEHVKERAEKKGIFETVRGTIQSLGDILDDLVNLRKHLVNTFNTLVEKIKHSLTEALNATNSERQHYVREREALAKERARFDRTVDEAADRKVADKIAELESQARVRAAAQNREYQSRMKLLDEQAEYFRRKDAAESIQIDDIGTQNAIERIRTREQKEAITWQMER